MDTEKIYKDRDIKRFLKKLNLRFRGLHKQYEEFFWKSYMGEPEYRTKMQEALQEKNDFESDAAILKKVRRYMRDATGDLKNKLRYWKNFFMLHQQSDEAQKLHQEIMELEDTISQNMASQQEGYLDPKTKKFKKMSKAQMREAMRVESNEKLRKAYFDGLEKLALHSIDEYVELVKKRNAYAKLLGYKDFYDFKIRREEDMSKEELFSLFDEVFAQTNYALKDIRKLEKKKKGLRKPWNYHYMMAGDITKEEDPYFDLRRALPVWGRTLHNIGIDFAKGRIQLDLIHRDGKYENPFCHWPNLVYFEGQRKISGSANFSSNAVIGQVGSGASTLHTLFHEGGHATHLLNSRQTEGCLNHEYLPMTPAWAETQSMFMDTLFDSYPWRSRYAEDKEGRYYPFELYQKRVDHTIVARPLYLNSIHAVMSFERDIYEAKRLGKKRVLSIAKKNFKKFFDRSEDSLWLLSVPHIYSFDSSASYHGYGLAKMAVMQWREYFMEKYGHIVDNKEVGKELKEMWSLGASLPFKDMVKKATGKKLSSKALIRSLTKSHKDILDEAQKRAEIVQKLPRKKRPVKLRASITMVHGHRKICSNIRSFEDMCRRYARWIEKNT